MNKYSLMRQYNKNITNKYQDDSIFKLFEKIAESISTGDLKDVQYIITVNKDHKRKNN